MTNYVPLIVGGGIAAVGGVLASVETALLNARRDRTRHERELAVAREQRNQDRISQAYLELVSFLQYYRERVAQLASITGPSPGPEEPAMADRRRTVRALAEIYGSTEVRRLLDEWAEHLVRLNNAKATIQMAEATRDHDSAIHQDADRELMALPGYATAIYEIDDAIRAQVRTELAHPQAL